MRVLVVNPGSSSLKLRVLDEANCLVFEHDALIADGRLDTALLSPVVDGHHVDAAGVRVVHGGRLRTSRLIDDGALMALDGAASLAPLHNPPALAAIRSLVAGHPGLPVVACLDSAFHASLPAAAATFALPWAWIEQWGIRRIGFHGFSHQHASQRAHLLSGRPGELRVVSCHLGSGASLAAVRGGRCVDTTMGFTPLDGLVMATRSGSVDPGAMLWLQQQARLTARDVERGLDRDAGLLGLSGLSGHMSEVIAAAGSGHDRSRLAVDVYLHRLRSGIGSMTVALGGLDALVFTGGVGEGSAFVRAAAADGLGFLGVAVDAEANHRVQPGGDRDITAASASVSTYVVHAREDLTIAAETRRVLTGDE